MEKVEFENIGDAQEPIKEKKNLAESDIQEEENEELEEEEEDMFTDMDMSAEQLARLAQIKREEIESTKTVIFDDGPVIVKPDIMKMKRGIEREMNDGSIVLQDEYPVIQRHPEVGDIQKILVLSQRNSRKWRKVMERVKKSWYKVSKKGEGFSTKYRFEPYEAE
jgi:hypothetical protein